MARAQTHAFEHGNRFPPPFRRGAQPEHGKRERHDRGDRLARIERGIGVLEHGLDAPGERPAVGCPDVNAGDADLAGIGHNQPQQHTPQRRFSRSGFADKAQHLAFADGEVGIDDGAKLALGPEHRNQKHRQQTVDHLRRDVHEQADDAQRPDAAREGAQAGLAFVRSFGVHRH
jgi:hypothetical protein